MRQLIYSIHELDDQITETLLHIYGDYFGSFLASLTNLSSCVNQIADENAANAPA